MTTPSIPPAKPEPVNPFANLAPADAAKLDRLATGWWLVAAVSVGETYFALRHAISVVSAAIRAGDNVVTMPESNWWWIILVGVCAGCFFLSAACAISLSQRRRAALCLGAAALAFLNFPVGTLVAISTYKKLFPLLPPKEWKNGTLIYSRWGLVNIFVWMMWGDVVYVLVERVFPQAMPLQLERLQIPKAYIIMMMATVTQIINMTMNPILSFRSDRTRTRFGRRIPFIAGTILPLSLCFAVLGFSDDIGAYLRHASWVQTSGIAPLWFIIVVMALFIILFDFANIFITSIYWYLFRDVIPSELMGRFTALYRAVGTIAGMFFAFFVQGYLETHTKYVYLGAAALCFFGFGVLVWRVKEGEYPPPKDEGPRANFFVRYGRMIKLYATECFVHPVFICYYLFYAMTGVSVATAMANNWFTLRFLHFTLQHQGHFMGMLAIFSVIMAFPLGWLVDKIHPFRAMLIGSLLQIPINLAGFFMTDFNYWMTIMAIRNPCTQLSDSAAQPLQVRLFPRKQYGQFGAAGGTLRSLTMLVGSTFGGLFIQFFDQRLGPKGCGYLWIWLGFFQTIAFGCLCITYLYWKKHGGIKFSYDPEAARADRLKESPPEPATVAR